MMAGKYGGKGSRAKTLGKGRKGGWNEPRPRGGQAPTSST